MQREAFQDPETYYPKLLMAETCTSEITYNCLFDVKIHLQTLLEHIPLLPTTVEKEMATHSSILAWRIPGMGKPGGLPSVGSHRVRHD